MQLNDLVKLAFGKYPKLLPAYVESGKQVVNVMVNVANDIMLHLIIVQGLDPTITPQDRLFKELQNGLNDAFAKIHETTFDNDFDFSWLHKNWEETRKKLQDKEMSKDKFVALTDLSHVSDVSDPPSTIENNEEVSTFKQIVGNVSGQEIMPQERAEDLETEDLNKLHVLLSKIAKLTSHYEAKKLPNLLTAITGKKGSFRRSTTRYK